MYESYNGLDELLTDLNSYPHQRFYLNDLVMMQMAGDFDGFIKALPKSTKNASFEQAVKYIELTREKQTSPKLFEGIVNKTIEAQFGNRYASLRELNQNSMDSYEPSDAERKINYSVEEQDRYYVLTVADKGCGMDLEGQIRDLLVPYNSPKEFNPNKIGEHGIGWYSTLDMAEFVATLSKTSNLDYTILSVVHNESKTKDGKWLADVYLLPKDAPLELNGKGTTVTMYIPKSITKPEQLKANAIKYVGHVSSNDARVYFNGAWVNNPERAYTKSKGVDVDLKGSDKGLTIAYSCQNLTSPGSQDDSNSDKIILTQRGLFIKNENIPFDEKTLHYKLMNSLVQTGVDFWVNLPRAVTLTKGRNSIIADNQIEVLTAEYEAFEDLFLSGVLGDDRIMKHPSSALLEELADIFESEYKSDLTNKFKQNYSISRRFHSGAITGAAKIIEVGGSVREWLGSVYDKMRSRTPSSKKKISSSHNITLEGILLAGGVIGAGTAIGIGAVIGLDALYKAYGPQALAGLAAIGLGALDVGVYAKNKFTLSDLKYNLHEIKDDLKKKLNIYVDVEAKRELKREKLRKKLAKKYTLKIKADDFFREIMSKDIIPAALYAGDSVSVGPKAQNYLSDIIGGERYVFSGKHLRGAPMRISIEKLIELYFKDKLKYDTEKEAFWLKDGDYFVDIHSNPLVNRIVTRLDQIKLKVDKKYDVKVLEDYLDTIGDFCRDVGYGFYQLFGIPYVYGKLAAQGLVDSSSSWYTRWLKDRKKKATEREFRARKKAARLREQEMEWVTIRENKLKEKEEAKQKRSEGWARRIEAVKTKFANAKERFTDLWKSESPPNYQDYTLQDIGDYFSKLAFKIRNKNKKDFGILDTKRVARIKPNDTAYLTLLDSIGELDRKISSIVGLKHLKPVYSFRDDVSQNIYFNDEALHINLDKINTLWQEMRGEADERREAGFLLLEELIEAKAQQSLYENGTTNVEGILMGRYDNRLLAENIYLRTEVLKYFAENKIDIIKSIEEVNKAKKNVVFTSLPHEFYKWLGMPPRILRREAAIDSYREEIWRKRQEEALKNA